MASIISFGRSQSLEPSTSFSWRLQAPSSLIFYHWTFFFFIVLIPYVITGLCNLKRLKSVLLSPLKSSHSSPLCKNEIPTAHTKPLPVLPRPSLWPHHCYLQRTFQTLKWLGLSCDFSKTQAPSCPRHLQAIYSVWKIGLQQLAWMHLSVSSWPSLPHKFSLSHHLLLRLLSDLLMCYTTLFL